MSGGAGPVLPARADRAVLEALPGAVFVIDELGTIVVATEQAGRLVDLDRERIEGTSVLDYVDPDATWATAAAMEFAMADVYGEAFSGPVRLSVFTSTGRSVAVDLWTTNRLDDPELRGLVCLLAPPTAALGIAEAVAAAGGGAPFAEVASAVAGALSGYPVIADAAVVRVAADGVEVVATHGVPTALLDGTAGDEPWRTAAQTGTRCTFDEPGQLPAALRDLAEAAGYRAVWAEPARFVAAPGTEPVASGADGVDVVVVFRRFAAEPTPNELSYVHQAASTLALTRLRPGNP